MTLGVDVQAVNEHAVTYLQALPRIFNIGAPVGRWNRYIALDNKGWLAHGRSPKNASLPTSKTAIINANKTAGMSVSLMYLLIVKPQVFKTVSEQVDGDGLDVLILIKTYRKFNRLTPTPCFFEMAWFLDLDTHNIVDHLIHHVAMKRHLNILRWLVTWAGLLLRSPPPARGLRNS